ncbi:hypothetical protein BC827DRAFT_1243374 [Russula dissimulans]|jgi:hypothetical protein|nr:hypothetical protein BC827DRAFT_1243374 [Russula dissimulans]
MCDFGIDHGDFRLEIRLSESHSPPFTHVGNLPLPLPMLPAKSASLAALVPLRATECKMPQSHVYVHVDELTIDMMERGTRAKSRTRSLLSLALPVVLMPAPLHHSCPLCTYYDVVKSGCGGASEVRQGEGENCATDARRAFLSVGTTSDPWRALLAGHRHHLYDRSSVISYQDELGWNGWTL